jgi:hypothetical protein
MGIAIIMMRIGLVGIAALILSLPFIKLYKKYAQTYLTLCALLNIVLIISAIVIGNFNSVGIAFVVTGYSIGLFIILNEVYKIKR